MTQLHIFAKHTNQLLIHYFFRTRTEVKSIAMLPTNRGFWLTLILSIVTLGIYQWYLVYAFARETNIACRRDGQNTTGLFLFIILTIITFGIYSIVWYCKWISRCNTYLAVNGQPQGLQVSTYLLSIFFGWLTLGIFNLVVFCKMLYLQNAVNNTYNNITGCTSEAPAGYAPAAV